MAENINEYVRYKLNYSCSKIQHIRSLTYIFIFKTNDPCRHVTQVLKGMSQSLVREFLMHNNISINLERERQNLSGVWVDTRGHESLWELRANNKQATAAPVWDHLSTIQSQR